MRTLSTTLLFIFVMVFVSATAIAGEDPYLWLEEVEGEEALSWVTDRSEHDTAELEAVAEFEQIHEELLEIYNSSDRIPFAGVAGDYLYNFWQDAEHVRGIWRRTNLESYLSEDTQWELMLDIDALAEAEDENWVWKGSQGLYPDYTRYLVSLSRGGGDATVVREFDATTKTWVEGGFELPEAKSRVSWRDENTVWVGTNFGEGSLSDSGYPIIVKLWTRGTNLEQAETIFTGETTDVSSSGYTIHTPEGNYDIVMRTPEFFRSTTYLWRGSELIQIDIPDDANFQGVFRGQLLVNLRSEWKPANETYPSDALLAIDMESFLKGDRDFVMLFSPEERVSLSGSASTENFLLYTTLDNVTSRLYKMMFEKGEWKRNEIELPGLGSAGVFGTSDSSDDYFLTYTDFLTPASLYYVGEGKEPALAKSSPSFFDAEGMKVQQFEAKSKDGTMIPYFVFTPKGYKANGNNPTLLYGYGGFEISMRPRYSGTTGRAWVERGGVYVMANIRGGGEFGPKWHLGAVRENHQNNFDDFAAVAKDLIARKVSSPRHLGIAGGSQGGLLVGGTFVQHPDLFKAVVCQVPLLDMKRFNKLLAGASWMAEYGNPDTEDWDNFMKFWSPYQNLDAETDYPKVFFTTSTRDDRVHPAHARKMVRWFEDHDKPVYYYENTEGGHAGAANQNQRAYMWSLTYAYLWKMLR